MNSGTLDFVHVILRFALVLVAAHHILFTSSTLRSFEKSYFANPFCLYFHRKHELEEEINKLSRELEECQKIKTEKTVVKDAAKKKYSSVTSILVWNKTLNILNYTH